MRTLWGWVVFAWRFEVTSTRAWCAGPPDARTCPPGATAVPYVGAVSLLLWVFMIGSAVELVALHLILPWEHVRLAADILGIWGLVWMLGFTASHYVYPHLLDADGSGSAAATTWPSTSPGTPWRERAPASAASTAVPHAAVRRRRALVVTGSRTNVESAPHAAARGAGAGHRRW